MSRGTGDREKRGTETKEHYWVLFTKSEVGVVQHIIRWFMLSYPDYTSIGWSHLQFVRLLDCLFN
jgi:hypothetical protein